MVDNGHISVMAGEVITGLTPKPGGIYVDATFGAGGHSQLILEACEKKCQLLALDRDPDAILRGEKLQQLYPEQFSMYHASFGDLKMALHHWQQPPIDGIIFDLGVSSFQLDQPQRGFSFRFDGPLDMRMDHSQQSNSKTAADLVNTLDVRQLADIFYRYGEESNGKKIARAIVEDRKKTPFTTTAQLAGLAERVIPSRKRGIHAATKIFQALRIAVNGELDQLQTGLEAAISALALGGRLLVISFHSLEDRIVKQTFRRVSTAERPTGPALLLPYNQTAPVCFEVLTKKPLLPTLQEQQANPRSRSAKMRILKRVAFAGNKQQTGTISQ